jgi:hypothetical protein
MQARSIEINIKPNGEIEIEGIGFQGADCEKATRFLEEALGNVKGKRRKSEYYRRALARRQQEART